jgi:GTP-binding protein
VKISDVEFIGSFGYPHKLPREARPEVAFFGRSNVGKSSLINTLLGRRGVARISKTPGKTRSANFFRINDRFHLVDMPGYGYAKVGKEERERWTKIFDQYARDDTRNNAIIQLLDIRHDPTQADRESVERLSGTERPLCLIFNKSDKVAKGQVDRRISEILRRLEASPRAVVMPFSSVTGQGKRELWGWITDILSL